MGRIETGVMTTFDAGVRKLGYAPEFKQVVRGHQGVLDAAIRLAQKAEDTYNPSDLQIGVFLLQWNKQKNDWQVIKRRDEVFKEPKPLQFAIWGRGAFFKKDAPMYDPKTQLEVTILGKSTRELGAVLSPDPNRLDISSYFRMRLGDKAFFVKKSYATTNVGYDEFSNSIRVREVLQDLKGVEVVEVQLGYVDDHQSWLVSKWKALEETGFFPHDTWVGRVPNDYGEYPEDDVYDKFFTGEHLQRVKKLQEEMKAKAKAVGLDIGDLGVNLFYNPYTDKFFYLDVTVKDGVTLNQELLWKRRKERGR